MQGLRREEAMTEYKENVLDGPKDKNLVTCCGNCRKPLGIYSKMNDAVTAMRGLYNMARKIGSPRQQSCSNAHIVILHPKSNSNFVLHVKEKHGIEL